MMPFNFLGTMRETQWRFFRNWVLNERRSVSARLRVINAELRRIGRITVFYRRREDTVQTPEGALRQVETVTEEREAFFVSPGSSLEKLVQAYVAVGGNPMSISLWLQPDEVQFTTDNDPVYDSDDNPNEQVTEKGFASTPFDQPYGGEVAPRSTDSYGPGGRYVGGLPTFIRDVPTQMGRYAAQADETAKIAIKVDHARRWVKQEISTIQALEARIIKLMDLREQLMEEREMVIQQAVGGSVQDFPIAPDADRFARNLHLTRIREIDDAFYKRDEDGNLDFGSINVGDASDPHNVVIGGIAGEPGLLSNPEGADPWAE
jgi:hypothetical protein